eukprot:4555168-Prymnesium_polylepis.1
MTSPSDPCAEPKWSTVDDAERASSLSSSSMASGASADADGSCCVPLHICPRFSCPHTPHRFFERPCSVSQRPRLMRRYRLRTIAGVLSYGLSAAAINFHFACGA